MITDNEVNEMAAKRGRCSAGHTDCSDRTDHFHDDCSVCTLFATARKEAAKMKVVEIP